MRIKLDKFFPSKQDYLLDLNRASDFSSFYEVVLARTYENLIKLIKPGNLVIDAGANIGIFSMIASSVVGNNGKVISIEPDRENFKILEHNIALNNVRNVTLIERALWFESNTLVGIEGTGMGSRISKDQEQIVSTITIDNLLEDINGNKILVKMDIEGSELNALVGAKESLRKIDAVMIEIHNPLDLEPIKKLLFNFDLVFLPVINFRNFLFSLKRHTLYVLFIEVNNWFRTLRKFPLFSIRSRHFSSILLYGENLKKVA